MEAVQRKMLASLFEVQHAARWSGFAHFVAFLQSAAVAETYIPVTMAEKFSVAAEIHICAPPEAVWAALTDPAKIRRYLFGTKTDCDWKVGSRITYSGEWQGKLM